MSPPPELNEDAAAEILLRLPPDDPACLVRAALVCKPWRRILSDPAFPRRYRAFHRAPPLLGFLLNRRERDPDPEFVPTSAASPVYSPEFDCDRLWTLDCRHGRVLFHSIEPTALVVWDPITGGHHHFPEPAYPFSGYAAAVLCAVDGCDHLDCHRGPFLVVFVSADHCDNVTRASLYSSETGAWSDKPACLDFMCDIKTTPCLLAGDALYFMTGLALCLVKFDLAQRDLSAIHMPEEYHYSLLGTVMTAEGGRLGLAGMEEYNLHLWSWQSGADDIEDWVHRVIDINSLLPVTALTTSPRLVGFTEGSNTVLMNTDVGAFAIELNSRNVRKIGERGLCYSILPYMSFYTPDLAEAILSQL
ncbi:hypothetical protein PR202_ga28506 [Eleusine coracana subsp. coracana]|uniref:F-box domain-containing protein n=1 Tax=Eleusine coracana subsp. coracana TaxID=191504 RepID=A0AAV5DIW6_ELECO|nr:hypothetical protein QOZ80_7AG0554000 [Eleusine coracana subsp. coracana]GJN10415.1 hypothetical protein PR202_ga28506 [Eleusine coracana subsp. coracana]